MNRRLLGNLGGRRDGTASTWNVPPQHPACGTPRTSKVAWGAPHFRTAPSPVPWPPRRHLLDAPIAGAYALRANRCGGPLPQRAACPPEAQARCRCRSSWVLTWGGGAWKPKEGRSFSRGTSRQADVIIRREGRGGRARERHAREVLLRLLLLLLLLSLCHVCLSACVCVLAEQRASPSVSLPRPHQFPFSLFPISFSASVGYSCRLRERRPSIWRGTPQLIRVHCRDLTSRGLLLCVVSSGPLRYTHTHGRGDGRRGE